MIKLGTSAWVWGLQGGAGDEVEVPGALLYVCCTAHP